MSDKARELLERAMGLLDYSEKITDALATEIELYLDEPEMKHEPLSADVVYCEAYKWLGRNGHSAFEEGVRFAEKHHGI